MKYRTYEVYTQSPTDFKHVLTINAGSIADAGLLARWIIPSCFNIIIREEIKNEQERSNPPVRSHT